MKFLRIVQYLLESQQRYMAQEFDVEENFITIIFVFGVIAASSSSKSNVQSFPDDTPLSDPAGGCNGTYRGIPSAYSMCRV